MAEDFMVLRDMIVTCYHSYGLYQTYEILKSCRMLNSFWALAFIAFVPASLFLKSKACFCWYKW